LNAGQTQSVRYFGGSATVAIHAEVREMGTSAFSGCLTCSDLDFSENVALERIDRRWFQWSSLRSIVIAKTARELGRKAFAYCHELLDFKFEDPLSLK
jgi:hypothetical protein